MDGQCASGTTVVTITTPDGANTYQQCVPSMAVQTQGIYSFGFCWNVDCMPAAFRGQTLNIAADSVAIPQDNSYTPPFGSRLVNTFLRPACVSVKSVSTALSTTTFASVNSAADEVVYLPPTGVSNITYRFSTLTSTCSEQYIAALLTIRTQPAEQPKVPTSSCPCWSVPQEGGLCPNITVPITLSTIGSDTNTGGE